MLKKIIFLFLTIFILSGCNNSDSVDSNYNEIVVTMDSNIDIENTVINQDIVFINMYKNWSEGYQCNGSLIDKNGYAYSFDFSDKPEDISNEEMVAEMKNIVNSEEKPSQMFSDKSLKYLYEILYRIDPNSGFKSKNEMFDYGQKTLYGVRYKDDGSLELVKIYSYGDWIEDPKDGYSQKLYEYYTYSTKKGN
ncbi:MAG TPA: membrane lipoprotein lipid attachment site-containing protein [Ruminococcus sp.]|nr:membrane lipoprotein lipid attachment site-containing protein [Ruminococcus sp.]